MRRESIAKKLLCVCWCPSSPLLSIHHDFESDFKCFEGTTIVHSAQVWRRVSAGSSLSKNPSSKLLAVSRYDTPILIINEMRRVIQGEMVSKQHKDYGTCIEIN